MAGVDTEVLTIQGLDLIEQKLQAMPEKIRRKHLRNIMTSGAEIVRKQAEQNARRHVGKRNPHLCQAISKKVSVTARAATATVGIDYKQVKHGHLVEFGTKPHLIGKRHHPGTSPRPFMRPAYDSHGWDALEHMLELAAKAVEKEVV